MLYAKVDGTTLVEFPYSLNRYKRENPNVSFPEDLSNDFLLSVGIVPVEVIPEPEFDRTTHKLTSRENPILESDGVWRTGFDVIELTDEEKAHHAETVVATTRNIRDNLLRDTDYLALSDNTLTEEMRVYRQSLRDITTHANFPNLLESDWPIKPEA